MRIRTIKPEFWTHPVMVRQDDASKLLALGLLNYADDEGYFYAEAAMVRAALRPLDEDSSIVRRSLDFLSIIDFIEIVDHSTHGPLGRIVSFSKHQKVDRPNRSKISMLWESSKDRRKIVERSSPDLGNKVPREQGNGLPPTPCAPASPPLAGEKMTPEDERAIMVARLFGRKLTTAWSPREIKAFKAGVKRGNLTVENLALIVPYYAAERLKGGDGIHRRELFTFLNNVEGEIDRAQAFASNPKAHDRRVNGAPLTEAARDTARTGLPTPPDNLRRL